MPKSLAVALVLSQIVSSTAMAQSPSIEVRPLLEGIYLFYDVVDENTDIDAFDALSALTPLDEESVIFTLDPAMVEMLGLQPVASQVWMLNEDGACVAPVGNFVAMSNRGSDDPAFTVAVALERCTSDLVPMALLSEEDLSGLSWHPLVPFVGELNPFLESWRTDVSNLSEDRLELLAWQNSGAEAGTFQVETDFSLAYAGGPDALFFVLYRQWLSIEGPDFSPSCANTVEILDVVAGIAAIDQWIALPDQAPLAFGDAGVIMSDSNIRFVVWEDAVGDGPASSNLGLMTMEQMDDGLFAAPVFVQTTYGHGEMMVGHPLEEWRCLP